MCAGTKKSDQCHVKPYEALGLEITEETLAGVQTRL
jgi:hypothetical protein